MLNGHRSNRKKRKTILILRSTLAIGLRCFTLTLNERRAWKAVHPNEVYEIGDKIPAMPDTEEGRYWLMSAKET